MFTCIECGNKYNGVNGDTEERQCFDCLYMQDAICSGCEKKAEHGFQRGALEYHYYARSDAYGIYTGLYCDDCYDSDKYPYRKDNYFDPAYCGERMEPDDF